MILRRVSGLVAFGLSSLAFAADPPKPPPSSSFVAGQVVRIVRPSPVFKEPRKKSKVLADADVGTTLVLRQASPQGLWLELEDEDGNRGWVPSNRTDFVAVPPAPPASQKNAESESDEPEPSNVRESGGSPVEAASSRVRWLVEARGGWTLGVGDPGGAKSVGGGLSVLFPGPTSVTGKLSWVGFSLGGEALLAGMSYGGFVIPVRYRQWSRYPGTAISFGPDAGILRFVHPKASDATSFEVAYGGGFSTGAISLTLRAGLRFNHGTRLHVGVACGYEL